jgi:amino acid adenylation domain-containing protein
LSDLSARLAELSPRRRELLLRQLARQQGEAAPERIPRQPRTTDRFPVSFSQLREWILDRLDPGTAAYNIPGGARFDGPLALPALRRAVDEIVRRHEALRTTFAATDGEPVQVVAGEARLAVPLVDLSPLPQAAREAEVARLTLLERSLGFDLARGPLLRVALLRLARERHVLLFTLHHIVSDGWSVGIFLRELGVLYDAFANGRPSPLPALPIQYPDFAVWQREWLSGEVLAAHVDYWREQLAGAPPLLELPADRPRPPVQTYSGARRGVAFPPELTAAVKALGQAAGATTFMAMLAGYQALLARYSGQDDVSVGTYTGSRGRAETEGLIGFFINTLVLRTRLDDRPGFAALMARVREVTLGAFAHQELPFEKLLEALRVARDLSHTPLFQALLVLQNYPARAVETADVRLQPLVEDDHVNFDLSLWLAEAGAGLTGTVQWNVDLFDAATVDRMVRHLAALLAAGVREPERPVDELALLAPEESRQLLADWSGAGTAAPAVPAGATVDRLIAAQAARTPEAVAVESGAAGGAPLSYRELLARSSRLARRLARLGVGPEAVVGLAAERSPEVVVGMLAVWLAGGAYLPLDPGYPEERLAWMLADARVGVLLTQKALAARWQALPGAPRLVLLDEEEALEPAAASEASEEAPESTAAPEAPPAPVRALSGSPPQPLAPLPTLKGGRGRHLPNAAAYVIYTSGSTGRPKGVVVEHRSLAAYALGAAANYGLGPGGRVLQFASISFDTSAEEIFPALASGATLVLRPPGMIDSPARFVAELGRLGITFLDLPTAYWHELAAALGPEGLTLPATLARVVIGGERALAERLALWRQAAGPVVLTNSYGPTEATIVAARAELTGGPLAEVPLGRPIPGARAYVVDRRLQPAPPGVAGELLIGGVGLARGYLGRPGATAAAFVPDPWGGEPGGRLYRSGDRVRCRPGGVLEYLGRLDQQVKIRGFRVEPGEVESALAGHPELRAAAVVARPEGGAGSAPRLVAYAVAADPERPPTTSDLHRHLAAKLPEHMLPAAFVLLPELPATPSGKLDRAALPAPEGARPRLAREYVPPASPVEEALAAIWAEVLGLERVGVEDNFFELGGHSLLATQVVAKVRERLQVELQLIALFQMPTIEQLAVTVEEIILDKIEELGDEEIQELL